MYKIKKNILIIKVRLVNENMILFQLSVVYLVIHSVDNVIQENNVCKNFVDYRTISVNKNCWYNPDVLSSTEDISKRHGYTAEKHTVMTEDGYMLIIYRITNNKKKLNEFSQPVILQYGIGGSTAFWILRGQDSIAFMLCDQGYDIWLTNIRGSTTQVSNETLSKDDPKYWDYSVDEHGMYDLPTMIDYVSNKTNNKQKLIYVGHSMGTTMSFIYASEKSDHAKDKLKGMIALAPVMYMTNSREPYQLVGSTAPMFYDIVNALRLPVIVNDASSREAIFIFCSTYPGIIICNNIFAVGNGKAKREERADLLPVLASYFPSPTTTKSITHFVQFIASKRFQKFDYGPLNQAKYNSSTPPEYKVDQISIPIHFFLGTNDAIATMPDVLKVYQKLLKNGLNTTIHMFDYAHNDFFIGRYYAKFYNELLNVLNILSSIK